MSHTSPFSVEIRPNWEGFLRCLRRQGTPDRVYFIELFLDDEVKVEIVRRYGLMDGLAADDPFYLLKREICVQRFLGYDYVRCGLDDVGIEIQRQRAPDTASLERTAGRAYIDEHRGPVTTWAEFEAFPWPDAEKLPSRKLEWFQQNLPDDMCLIASGGFAHFAEYLTWLMGYETLCYALFDQRDLVTAISRKLLDLYEVVVRRISSSTESARSGVRTTWGTAAARSSAPTTCGNSFCPATAPWPRQATPPDCLTSCTTAASSTPSWTT